MTIKQMTCDRKDGREKDNKQRAKNNTGVRREEKRKINKKKRTKK